MLMLGSDKKRYNQRKINQSIKSCSFPSINTALQCCPICSVNRWLRSVQSFRSIGTYSTIVWPTWAAIFEFLIFPRCNNCAFNFQIPAKSCQKKNLSFLRPETINQSTIVIINQRTLIPDRKIRSKSNPDHHESCGHYKQFSKKASNPDFYRLLSNGW